MSQLNIHWDCEMEDCYGHYLQILPMTEAPRHVCQSTKHLRIERPLILRNPDEKTLAIRARSRYGNNRPAEKNSAQHAQRGHEMSRATPADTPAGTDTTASTSAAKGTKAKAEKAAKAPAPAKPKAEKPAVSDGPKTRRVLGDRGHLAREIEKVLRGVESGKVKIEQPVTVGKVRALITNGAGEQPSTGAVSAAFDRWAREGYIKFSGKPAAFGGFAAKWTAEKGGSLEKFLTGIREAAAAARAAARPPKAVKAPKVAKAAKPAKAPAKKAAAKAAA